MEKHLNLVGILNIAYRGMSILGAVALLFLAAIFGRLFEWLIRTGAIMPHEVPIELLDIIPALLVVIAVIILAISIVGIVAGIGVLKKREWGRVLLLIISFINLLHIPLGTALGAYSIWVLMNDASIKLFGSSPDRI